LCQAALYLTNKSISALLLQPRDIILFHETQRDLQGRVSWQRAPIWYRDALRPTITYDYDRWNNIVRQLDSHNNEEISHYDKRNLLIQTIQPEVATMQDNLAVVSNARKKTIWLGGVYLCQA
jgi:hypothetical protein